MPLTPAIAESTGAAIASALASLPRGSEKSADAWKIAVTQIFAAITANGVVTIPPSAIATTGGPAAQSGPAAPVLLQIT